MLLSIPSSCFSFSSFYEIQLQLISHWRRTLKKYHIGVTLSFWCSEASVVWGICFQLFVFFISF
jgi:hypothetical protein